MLLPIKTGLLIIFPHNNSGTLFLLCCFLSEIQRTKYIYTAWIMKGWAARKFSPLICILSEFCMNSRYISLLRSARWAIPFNMRSTGLVMMQFFRAELKITLLEGWLALTSVKYHGNLLILMLFNQWLAPTMLRPTGPRSSMNWSRAEFRLTL